MSHSRSCTGFEANPEPQAGVPMLFSVPELVSLQLDWVRLYELQSHLWIAVPIHNMSPFIRWAHSHVYVLIWINKQTTIIAMLSFCMKKDSKEKQDNALIWSSTHLAIWMQALLWETLNSNKGSFSVHLKLSTSVSLSAKRNKLQLLIYPIGYCSKS